MAIKRNNAGGQTAGTTLTAGNSGGGSGDAFIQVVTNAGGDITFDATHFHSDSMAYRIDGIASSSAASVSMLMSTAPTICSVQCYAYFTGYPTGGDSLLAQGNADEAIAYLFLTTSGGLRVSDYNGTDVLTASSGIVPLNAMLRIDIRITIGTTPSNGRIQAQISLGDSTTPLWSGDTGATVDTETIELIGTTIGKLGGSGIAIPYFWIDDVAIQDNSTDFLPPTAIPMGWAG